MCCTCVQELQTPELQPLSMESKAALALLKYLPLSPQVIPQVITHTHTDGLPGSDRTVFVASACTMSVSDCLNRGHVSCV